MTNIKLFSVLLLLFLVSFKASASLKTFVGQTCQQANEQFYQMIDQYPSDMPVTVLSMRHQPSDIVNDKATKCVLTVNLDFSQDDPDGCHRKKNCEAPSGDPFPEDPNAPDPTPEPSQCPEAGTNMGLKDFPVGTSPVAYVCSNGCEGKLHSSGGFACDDNSCFGSYIATGDTCDGSGSGGGGAPTEPTDPTPDPTDPTDPTPDPTDPTDPNPDPTDPTDPNPDGGSGGGGDNSDGGTGGGGSDTNPDPKPKPPTGPPAGGGGGGSGGGSGDGECKEGEDCGDGKAAASYSCEQEKFSCKGDVIQCLLADIQYKEHCIEDDLKELETALKPITEVDNVAAILQDETQDFSNMDMKYMNGHGVSAHGSCPPDRTFTITIGSMSKTFSLPYQPLCDAVTTYRPIVILFGWISGLGIIGRSQGVF
ncbi:virulence factor TspB C-terminal domain-related protein [Vibrio nigripulchritudo]|uniref:virulence factor TspB C-terminal domain-related protein n=1 Tax=Vibrio nigripulchritudo TaxID=28173 RepID=UPI002492F4BD|nr:virulence factor TspB C-terminal domain-related protein [Vibrio nigripulchritudo]BDU37176.1 hypothetical protein TUMSATVNIG2_16450 [Vibrio nigripulchritudo]